jgi:hypothetical protein
MTCAAGCIGCGLAADAGDGFYITADNATKRNWHASTQNNDSSAGRVTL